MSDLRCRPWFVPVIFAACVTSCGGDETVLAKIGSQQLEIAPFQIYVGEVTGETWQAVSARVSSGLLDQYLDRQVVLEAARRHEIDLANDPSSLGPSEVQWLLDELCGPAENPPEVEVAQEVERRSEETLPAKAHVRQLLVDSEEKGREALDRLVAGEDFLEVSRVLSRAPNAADGGELGFFDQGSLPPEIDEVIFSLAPGEYSDPVQGPSGYHVFQVLEVIPPGPPNIAAVEAVVRGELAQTRLREHTQRCIRRLAAEVGIEIYGNRLWFPYVGRYAEEMKNA